MWKLNEIQIDRIQTYHEDFSNAEIAREMWINRKTVAKYRAIKATQQQAMDALNGNEAKKMWLARKLWEAGEPPKLSKRDQKKLDLLQQYSPKDVEEMLNFIAKNTKKEIDKVIGEPWHLKFGLVSDTHLWAKQSAIDELGEFYDRAKDAWVECFVHCWDLVDWAWVYSWQQFEQSEVWFDDQVKLVKEKYPDVWLPTYFIAWNHSESYLKWGGADIAKAIETVRKDLINLWFYDATIKLNGITIQLRHGGWGSSYALDYKLNKFIDKIPAWKEPDIFALGHYHQALYALHRDIHGFLPWSFLKENMLSKRFQLWNTVWGWIIEIEKDKNWKSRINMEYIKF